ncbi:MAG: PqqD family protein [Candidatus Bathyarchaeia archaeon]
MEKLKKKGKVAKDQKGKTLLVNEKGEAVAADQVAIAIWDMCEGNVTSEDVVNVVAERTSQDKSRIEKPVENILEQLEKFGLLEKTG